MLYRTVTPNPETDQIVFVHIRKTAGTALASVLFEALGAHPPHRTHWGSAERAETGVLAIHGPLRRAAINLGEEVAILARRATGRPVYLAEDQAFFAAHMILGTEPPSPRPKHYITVVRDPADRFVSDHAFMAKKRDRARSDCLDHALYDLPLEGFVAAIEKAPEKYRHDYQCRQLAGGRPDADEARRAVDERLWLAAPVPELPAFMDRIAEALGRPLAPLKVTRATKGRAGLADLPEELVARIRALNPGDAALVAHVTEEFHAL